MRDMPVFKAWVADRGGLVKAAAELGVTKHILFAWLARGQVPAIRCPELSRRLGIARWDLRPGDWHLIWPEIAWQPGAPLPADRKRA